MALQTSPDAPHGTTRLASLSHPHTRTVPAATAASVHPPRRGTRLAEFERATSHPTSTRTTGRPRRLLYSRARRRDIWIVHAGGAVWLYPCVAATRRVWSGKIRHESGHAIRYHLACGPTRRPAASSQTAPARRPFPGDMTVRRVWGPRLYVLEAFLPRQVLVRRGWTMGMENALEGTRNGAAS
ncbi:hypothetical protein L227DRAFT_11574 [Lentinus tigrinus ALCF2SS1-6]|uniref:Uncharacterized protein n=1 Tax=Lentinus tigrinus ALCF2SS1-6 TaxID=1328759 RepID=A0A5C2SUD3_9APHY|nr:hypothetical protein L227DRAFT_11574 [Lentinus tigrinus ALCF2SS1-6]